MKVNAHELDVIGHRVKVNAGRNKRNGLAREGERATKEAKRLKVPSKSTESKAERPSEKPRG